MNQIQKNKLYKLLFFTLLITVVVGLISYALRQNINLYFTPAQIKHHQAPIGKMMRAGGMVVKGSIMRAQDDLKVQFDITDYTATVSVVYRGILPDLFREGQGVVIRGRLNDKGIIEAEEVLAKHDENYMPPEVKASLTEKQP
jgi:cytochrome c-type biogenesis protein CcmE